MTKRLKSKQNRISLPATACGPKPGDFPVGSLKSRAAARALLVNYAADQDEGIELGNLTPYELATSEGASGQLRVWLVRLARVVEQQAECFGFPLPTPEEIRHNRKVAEAIDEMTGGQNLHISLSNSVEWNRLKALAEDVLSGKRAFTDSEIVAVRTIYGE